MHLSVVIPSNRVSWAAYSLIMRACSWANEALEVVVRDNSGDTEKRRILRRIEQSNCNIVFAAPCDMYTNFTEALRLASGKFVLFMGDDDYAFDRGIAAVTAAADRHDSDPSIAGLTGAYVLEETARSHVVSYSGLDSSAFVDRVDGFLGYQGPNLIFCSAIRRELALDTFEFVTSHPFRFSYHDYLYSLIYLLSGRFINVGRLAFLYDNAHWETADVGAQGDLKFYTSAGLDPSIRQFHWLLCGFEGASIILQSRFGLRHPLEQRQAAAAKWFEVMFRRFAGDSADAHGSVFAPQAATTRDRLLRAYPTFSLEDLLADICELITLFSPEKARLYRDFWTSNPTLLTS